MINAEKMKALADELRKGSSGRYRWYAMGRDETSYFMDFDWGYDADRWFADQQRSRAAWIEQEGIHLVKKLFQTELETNAAAAADAIDLLLAEVEAAAADKRDGHRYRELLGLLLAGDIPMPESSVSLNVCGVPPNQDEFDKAVDFLLAQRQGEGS
ncbi:hypothetical protein [Burkholderia vietnamiensis]|uniref:hypothetical protein n=1 Tax=Burkholderia vietnamiensis TaxID=60552 RepID=UPI001CAE2C71|nr:hypothetical protein [Burkholderia vietnamiensis]CAG9225656.1 conserved hypothetical protein [Burkholderia vietnamiensis]